ncbi:MAG: bile acid:sodium symporter family protein [Flavobacteriales bacterium]|nr:bile acid:sodium symporter family protein [Flavobacteriales bacterium]
MESDLITDVFLPLALAIIMLGMGLSLTIDDFKRVVKFPKAVAIGLVNQLLILPFFGFLIAKGFQLEQEFAVGIMILVACPGGVTSNLLSHLSKGDTALSVTLTAISSLVTIFTVPFIINFGLDYFMASGQQIQLPIAKTMATIFGITLLPISIGMIIRSKSLSFADKMERPVKIASTIFLVIIIAGAIAKNKEVFTNDFITIIVLSTFTLNVLTMVFGFFTSKVFKLNLPQSITISLETGVQNGTTAIFIAATLLANSAMSIPPAIYSLVMFFTSAFVIFKYGKR